MREESKRSWWGAWTWRLGDKIREWGRNILKSKCKLEKPPHKCISVMLGVHACKLTMCTNSVGSIQGYVLSKPLRAGWSILIRIVSCSADVYWAAVCSYRCTGVLPCFTCPSVIWRDAGSSLGVCLSNDRQLLITDQQWGRNPSVLKAVVIEMVEWKLVALLQPPQRMISCFWRL